MVQIRSARWQYYPEIAISHVDFGIPTSNFQSYIHMGSTIKVGNNRIGSVTVRCDFPTKFFIKRNS